MIFSEVDITGIPVFELTGKIMGSSESLDLGNRLKALIGFGKKNIILDFSKVQWINSAGIGKILSWVMTLRWEGDNPRIVWFQQDQIPAPKKQKTVPVLEKYPG